MMNQMKKAMLIILVLTMVFVLAACGGNAANKSGNTGGNKNGGTQTGGNNDKQPEKVKIVFGQGADQTEGTKLLLEAFHKKFPNIEVELREFPNNSTQMHDQYVTIFGGKSSEIDVLNLDVVWPAEFAQAGFLQPLDRFIADSNLDIENYLQGGVDAGYFNGQQWALPRYNNTGLLYYRTDLVDKAPETWEELIEQATALKGQGGTKFGYALQAKQYEGLVVNFTEFTAAYGGQVIDDKGEVVINSPEAIKGLKKMMEIVQSDFVPVDVTTFTEKETLTAFLEGETVFARHWPAMFAQATNPEQSKVVDNVAIAPLPAGDARSAAALGGWMAGISKFSEHPQEAWEFLNFMISAEGQKIVAIHSTQTPTYLPLYDDEEVQKASPLFANKDFVNGISGAVPRPITPIYPEISDIIQIEVSKALAGQQTAEQAIKNMEEQMKKVVNK